MDGIVLLSKRPGKTSFSSLNNVKKSFNTTKVGHTGTLDSFAQGLLVVCVGKLTRLAGNITEFDKTYEAIIKFGQETDTLEYTGNIIKNTELPLKENLEKVIRTFVGEQMQIPPAFSAIHVDGKRASDLARKNNEVSLPARKINVYSAEIKELKCNSKNEVEYCKLIFHVSKGTYIRSLARDIGLACGSSGHLIGLFRTKVGNFSVENSAGFSLLDSFTIENSIKQMESWKKENHNKIQLKEKYVPNQEDEFIKSELTKKICKMDEEIGIQCGFQPVHIKEAKYYENFKNGKPIMKHWFEELIDNLSADRLLAVFTKERDFCGLIEKIDSKHFSYKFVIN